MSDYAILPAKTMTDADNADDLVLHENTPVQAEYLLQSLEQAAEGIGSTLNANKTKYICVKQKGTISNWSA